MVQAKNNQQMHPVTESITVGYAQAAGSNYFTSSPLSSAGNALFFWAVGESSEYLTTVGIPYDFVAGAAQVREITSTY
jgi:hypothetical protein